jgi:hypothetical protein
MDTENTTKLLNLINSEDNLSDSYVHAWHDEDNSKFHLKSKEFSATLDSKILPYLVDALIDLQNK